MQREYLSDGINAGKVDLTKTEENIKALNLEEIENITPSESLLVVTLRNGKSVTITGVNGRMSIEEIIPFETKVKYSYDGTDENLKDWIVISKNLNEGTVEIVSLETIGSLTLGEGDTETTNEDIDKDGDVDEIDNGIYSYNNAINRINDYCEQIITNQNKISVRSVGGKEDTNNYFIDTNYEYFSAYSGVGKGNLSNLEIDSSSWDGIRSTGDIYWYPERTAYINEINAYFGVGIVKENGDGYFPIFWNVWSSGSIDIKKQSYGVRPVVTIKY